VQGILDLGVSYTCLMKADKVALTDAIDYSYTDKYTWLDTFQNPDVSFVCILTKNALRLSQRDSLECGSSTSFEQYQRNPSWYVLTNAN